MPTESRQEQPLRLSILILSLLQRDVTLYDVKVTDGVCNLAGSEAAASDTIEARQPMLIAMDEVSNICEGSSVNLKMSLKKMY